MTKKKKSCKSFDLQDFAEREGDDIRSPSSVTRWFSIRVRLKISSFSPCYGAELARDKTPQITETQRVY